VRRERLIARIVKKSNLGPHLIPAQSLDIVGDIAIVKLPEAQAEMKSRLADALLREVPSIKVVYQQTGPVAGDFRLRNLEWLAGEKRSFTTYKEHGCNFEVDVVKDYFSPRLAHERTIVAKQVKAFELGNNRGQTIVNMFAGVGTFSIRIAKETSLSRIYSIDLNPDAFTRMFRNVMSNKMLERVVCMFGDSTVLVENVLRRRADRVLMPLPEKYFQYLGSAITALRPEGGIINLQNFTHAGKRMNPKKESRSQLETTLQNFRCTYIIEDERVIRPVGPGWYQVAHDIKIMST